MQPDLTSILEENLRGLNMPQAISWWPLAWGWWIVIAIIASVLLYALYRRYCYLKANKYRGIAIKELQDSFIAWQKNADTHRYLHNANGILKRVVRQFNQNSVSHTGAAWSKTLNQFARNKLPNNTLRALSEDCYKVNPQVDVMTIHNQLKQWLKTHMVGPNA